MNKLRQLAVAFGVTTLLVCLAGLSACGRQEGAREEERRRLEEPVAAPDVPAGPDKLVIKGFELGMTLQEACDLINTRHAEAFPPPIIAFDECCDRKALEGAQRLAARYRNPYLKGNEPWTNFPVQPVKIETLDPYWLATAELLVVREGLERHILYYDQCFVADGRLYSARYEPQFMSNGEREVNDNGGARFEAGDDGFVRTVFLAAPVTRKLFGAGNMTGEQFAQTVADHCGIPRMQPGTHRSLSGYDMKVWIYRTASGETLTVFENKNLLLERLVRPDMEGASVLSPQACLVVHHCSILCSPGSGSLVLHNTGR